MKKIFHFALMAAMLLPSALLLNACGGDDKDDPDSGDVDARLEKVIPSDIRRQMEKYMTIYDGVNPPNVEGIYLMSPQKLVYDSTNNFDTDHKFADLIMNLFNQNSKNNTIDYKERQGSNLSASGNGAFISGEGNNFSIYFNTSGNSNGISYKTALVVSGTISSDGIRNLYYAFVMTDKGSDPEHTIMNVGDYRVFKDGDGLAVNSEWPSSTRVEDLMDGTINLMNSLVANN